MKNSTLRLALTAIVVMLSVTVSFAAAGLPTSGFCGDPAGDASAMTWQYDMLSGTLTISGTGEMENFTDPGESPWYSWADDINTVILSEGITTIGDYAFYNIPLTSIQTQADESWRVKREEAVEEPVASVLPESLNAIGKYALANTRMTSLTLPSQLVSIGQWALAFNSQLTTLTCLSTMTLPSLGFEVLASCDNLTAIYVPETCVDDYKNDESWQAYASLIKPMPEQGDEPGGDDVEQVTGSLLVAIPSGEFTPRSSSNLPSAQYYCKYSMSQQIYMKEEIGKKGKITSIAFYSYDNGKPRTYDIYLTHTAKQSFTSNTDWVTVAAEDKVFSGSVKATSGQWTVVDFDTPFEYNGTQNLLLTVDDNSGEEAGSSCDFQTFDSRYDGQSYDQALYYSKIFTEPANLDPTQPIEESGAYYGRKNSIQLCFESSPKPYQTEVVDVADVSAKVQCTLRGGATAWNVRYRQVAAEGEEEQRWTVSETSVTDPSFTITGLTAATQYEVQVQAVFDEENLSDWTSSLTFITSCCPAEDMSELLWSAYGYSSCESAFKIVDHETGIEMAYVSMANENAFGGYLNLCCGRTYDVYWISNKRWPGSDDYCTFSLFYLPGDEFYSMMPGEAPEAPNGEEGKSYLMTSFVMDCTPYCTPMPRFLTATDVNYQGATFTYQATTLKEELQYSTDETFPEDQTTTVEVTRTAIEDESVYTLTGLETLTIYYIRARSVCDDSESEEIGDKYSRWTKTVRIITDTKFAAPSRPTADPRDPRTEGTVWKRNGMEGKNNVNYRTAGEGTPAGEPIAIDLDGDGETFESWGGTSYGSYGKRGVDNVLAVANVPANALVSWGAADGNSMKQAGSNTVRFQYGFYKQSKKFDEGEEAAAKEELTQKMQEQKKEEQDMQQNTGKLQELLDKAKQLEKELEEQSSEGFINISTKMQLIRLTNQIEALQNSGQPQDAGNTSAAAKEVAEQPTEARSMRAPESDVEEYYFFFIRHTEPDEILLVNDITITPAENIGDWITVPDVENVEYALSGLKPSTTYELMVEPVYDSGAIGIASPITVFTTIGAEADPVEGEFSVAEGKKVKFSRGNLRFSGDEMHGTWSMAQQQYEVLGEANVEAGQLESTYPADLRDLFCWSTADTSYGNQSYYFSEDTEGTWPYFYGELADWGANPALIANLGTGWSTLSKDEWSYLLNDRDNAEGLKALATVAGVKGLILMPDGSTAPEGFTLSDSPLEVTAEAWTALETVGAVFLPAVGQMEVAFDYENYKTTTTYTAQGAYWTSTPADEELENAERYATGLAIGETEVTFTNVSRRVYSAVRLVKAVPVADKTALEQEIADANDYYDSIKDDFATHAATLKEAIDEAQGVDDKSGATQEEVDAAQQTLADAVAKVKTAVDEETTTGISEMISTGESGKQGKTVYDLQGHRMNASANASLKRKGVYIVNGRKVVVK